MSKVVTAEAPRAGWVGRFRGFIKDVRAELAKVSWPTREELRDSTVVVIVTVLIVAAYIGIIDRVLGWAMSLLFR